MTRSFKSWRRLIFDPDIPFRHKVMEVFRHQITHVPMYSRFCKELGIGLSNDSETVPANRLSGNFLTESDTDSAIPLIPIQVFRDFPIRHGYIQSPEAIFRSSGTTGSRQSTHEIADLTLYQESCLRGFSRYYDFEQFSLLALLPGYSDNPNSSLVKMIDTLIRHDRSGLSRFLPLDHPFRDLDLDEIISPDKRVLLFGAAFGLLDLIEDGAPDLPDSSIIVETGGMKTNRREISKKELHNLISEGFRIPPESVHSEYGMAEMCSQAWNTGHGRFQCPPWLRITIRNAENPMAVQPVGEEGLIGVMDLANVHSLSFFLTQDRGVAWPDGSFQVLGRWDFAELRGCNFLIEQSAS